MTIFDGWEIKLSSRTPQGVRGLKFALITKQSRSDAVAPRKGCVD